MAFASRSNKTPSGGTAWVADDDLNADPLNGDIDNILTELNGNIENVNISNTAGIVGTKLASGTLTDTQWSVEPGEALSSAKVDDYASTDAEQNTISSPGDSDSNTLPAGLRGELEQLRNEIRKIGTGLSAKITDGSTSGLGADGEGAWFDGVIRGRCHLVNGAMIDIAGANDLPTNWSLVGTATFARQALPVTEGSGTALRVTDSGAGTGGVSQIIGGLKASHRYLFVARVRPVTGTVVLTSTGATGTFGNLNLTSGSGTGAYETMTGIIDTDNVPTNIRFTFGVGSASGVFDVRGAKLLEISDDPIELSSEGWSDYRESTSSTLSTIQDETTIKIAAQGKPPYSVLLDGRVVGAGTGNLVGAIEQSLDGGSTWDVILSGTDRDGGGEKIVPLSLVVPLVLDDSEYWFRLTGDSGSGNFNTNVVAGDFASGGRHHVHELSVVLHRR